MAGPAGWSGSRPAGAPAASSAVKALTVLVVLASVAFEEGPIQLWTPVPTANLIRPANACLFAEAAERSADYLHPTGFDWN